MNAYLATEGSQQDRPFGSYQATPLRAFGQRTLLIPFRFTFTDGVLVTTSGARKGTQWLFASQTLTTLRIQIPKCPARNVMICLLGGSDEQLFSALSKTGAPSGYIELTVAAATGTFQVQGFIAIHFGGTRRTGAVSNAAHFVPRRQPLNARQVSAVGSPFRELFVAPFDFVADGSGDPVDTSFRGPRGFAVDHAGVGQYVFGARFDEPCYFAPVAEGLYTVRDGEAIDVVDSDAESTELTEGEHLTSLLMAPLAMQDRQDGILCPATRRPLGFTLPSGGAVRCGIRDGIFIPFHIVISGGAIVESSSFIPEGLRASIVAGAVRLEFGTCPLDQFFIAGQRVDTNAGLTWTRTTVPTHGYVTVTPGASFWGYIIASNTDQR